MSKVVITGTGFITSIGNSKAEVSDSLQNLKHGVELYPPFADEIVPVKVLAPIKNFTTEETDPEDWTIPSEYKIHRTILRSLPPHGVYAYCAMSQAIADAGLANEDVSNVDTGMYTASAGSAYFLHYNLDRLHKMGVQRCSPMGIIQSIAGSLNFNLVSAFKIRGSSTGLVSACASSGHALGLAYDEIKSGRQQRMFVVGAEDGDLSSILPFASMRALSLSTDPDKASRPFDKDRDGFVGTGGASVLVLESEELAKERGAKIYAEFAGWGQASDGYNPAISHPEGDGLSRAMEIALKSTDSTPSDIDYLNAHATSTTIGDTSEIKAIKKVFGDAQPAISSTKALTGHGLSLASIMEAGFCLVGMEEGFMPGSAHIENLDPEAEGLNIIREKVEKDQQLVMSNSSGFGGANVSLIFKKY